VGRCWDETRQFRWFVGGSVVPAWCDNRSCPPLLIGQLVDNGGAWAVPGPWGIVYLAGPSESLDSPFPCLPASIVSVDINSTNLPSWLDLLGQTRILGSDDGSRTSHYNTFIYIFDRPVILEVKLCLHV